MPSRLTIWLVSMMVAALPGCSRDSGSGPIEVKWDRDTCERCRMVLSDRYHAAQVRGGLPGAKARVYKFDDLGGAILWLQEQPWKDAPATELWVTDHRDGRWIDGFSASYLDGQLTPMDFGLGAQDQAAAGAMNYQQARAHLLEAEAQRHAQGAAAHQPRGVNP